ncbi:hypothetical protein MLD38_013989 [Melastoma candidum]|uniref:Uncharacterized protein n=1 Tax=Melastoma candidum TaxID=119954 RepID=A0ACB9RAQ4_9MYRT|nr:hypothetical protein MLD38_013989 [Melastoma candidum]
MEEDEIEKLVTAYLKKRGFKDAELAFQEGLHRHPKTTSASAGAAAAGVASSPIPTPTSSSCRSPSASRSVPEQYQDGYGRLDSYKHELLCVLYPVFIHCFMDLIAQGRSFFNSFRDDHSMMHSGDLLKLEGVLSPSHLEEMEFAHYLRNTKATIKICQSFTMLGIINQWINFQVSPGQPTSLSDDVGDETIFTSDGATQINPKEIQWGGSLFFSCLKIHWRIVLRKGPFPLWKPIRVKEKLKRLNRAIIRSTEVEHSILEDLRNRVQLSSTALPSVSFYTFVNTHNGLNCSTISQDGSLVAGGFSDSSLKVWGMAKLGQQSAASQGENDMSNGEHAGPLGGRRSYSLYQGHSGPVHAVTFSPLGDFILSSSADSTVRLWSTKLNANLVCYKGHNYRVGCSGNVFRHVLSDSMDISMSMATLQRYVY